MIRAIIIEDQQAVIDVLEGFLCNTGKVEVIATFTNPFEALKNIKEMNPDVVLLDLEIAGMQGTTLDKAF